jgi:peroxiredoxin
MAIKVGDRLPDAKFRVMSAEGPTWKSSDEIFKGRKVALFAVPGAFTSACHRQHMPTIVKSVGGFKAKGVDVIAVTAVNDEFVLAEWKKTTDAVEVELLADGNADFAKAIDLVLDLTGSGMGLRSRRRHWWP